MPLVAWPPYWRCRRALEVCKVKSGIPGGVDGGDWLELEDALSDLGQLAITVEELRTREEGPRRAR